MIGGGYRVVAQAGNIQDAIVLADGFFQRSDLGTNLRIGALKHWRFKIVTGLKTTNSTFTGWGLWFMEAKMGRGILLWLLGVNSHHNLAVVVPRPLTRCRR